MNRSDFQPAFKLAEVVAGLRQAREDWRRSQHRSREPGGRELPSSEALADILQHLRGILFPMRLGPPELRQSSEDFYIGYTLDQVLNREREIKKAQISLLVHIKNLLSEAQQNKLTELRQKPS